MAHSLTGKMFKNLPLTLIIDDKKYNVRTNNEGIFTFNYQNSSLNPHTLVMIFEGNSDYNRNQKQITFIPQLKKEKLKYS